MSFNPVTGRHMWSNNMQQHDKWWRNDERYLRPETLARLENIEDEIERRTEPDESGDVE